MTRIAVLGTGAMGSRMATSLIRANHEVTVWNRTIAATEPLVELGALACESPAKAATGTDFVISMVRDNDASREVWLDPKHGALDAMAGHAVAIESSTLTPEWVRELAKSAAGKGITFLEAPVAGTLPQADAAELIYLAGGDAAVVEDVAPLLMAMGKTVHHAGPVGTGSAIKLAINALLGLQVAALGELLAFTTRQGIRPRKAVEIITSTPICSPAAQLTAWSIIEEKFDPMFPVDLVAKDFSYIGNSADAVGAEVPLSATAGEVYTRAKEAGFGELNINGVAKLFEE